MFGSKRNKDCSTCEVERIKELQEEKKMLQAKLDELNKMKDACVYNLAVENLRSDYKNFWGVTNRKAFIENVAKIIWLATSNNYSDFNDIVSKYFYSGSVFARQLVDFFNGYLEWNDNRLEYEQKINKATYEIKALKDRLGIE